MKNKTFFWAILLVLVLSIFFLSNKNKEDVEPKKENINTLLMLIEFERIEGVLQWEKELDARCKTALVKVQDNVLMEHPEVFKRLAQKNYEIAGGYDEAPFWGMSYEEQYEHLKSSKELVEEITGKEMRVFGSRYFAYDETTLQAADDLGIKYILGRGVNDVLATVYQPEEYQVKIISVTNVDVGEPMGRGSLCDYSLWARGAGAKEFGEILEESLLKKPTDMILVSHAYLGGTRLEWWNEYKKALTFDNIDWNNFDDWINNLEVITLPNSEIPTNDEVNYVTPTPEKAMEDYDPIPEMEGEDIILEVEGLMCQ